MWIMMKYEFKKMFHSPMQKLLPLLLILLPCIYALCFTQYDSNDTQKIYTDFKGEMNEEWSNKVDAFYISREDDEQSTDLLPAINMTLIKPFTVDQIWNPDTTAEEFVSEAEKEYPIEIREIMNDVTFCFGNYVPAKALYQMMIAFGPIFAIYLALTITPIFSQEHQMHMMDCIKATKIGKQKTAISKILCSLILVFGIPLIALPVFYLITILTKGVLDLEITLAVFQSITPYTFQDVVLYGTLILLTGGLAVCSCSLLISSYIKSSYVSMAVSLVLLLIPMILYININGVYLSQFVPFFYMIISNVFDTMPFMILGDMVMLYKDIIPVLWIPISIVLLLLCLIKYHIREA